MTRLSDILMVLGGSGPVLDQTSPRTTQDQSQSVLSGPGPGLFKKGKKTRLDWTFKHYIGEAEGSGGSDMLPKG